jgi:ribosome-associated protein
MNDLRRIDVVIIAGGERYRRREIELNLRQARYNPPVHEPLDSISRDSNQIELAPGVHVMADELRVQFARSGGPGGQNVNKLNTKIELWIPLKKIHGLDENALLRLRTLAGRRIIRSDVLHLTAQTERTQERNRQAVFDRLRVLIEQALIAPKPRKRTRPSKAAKRRRIEAKRRRGEIKAARRESSDW